LSSLRFNKNLQTTIGLQASFKAIFYRKQLLKRCHSKEFDKKSDFLKIFETNYLHFYFLHV